MRPLPSLLVTLTALTLTSLVRAVAIPDPDNDYSCNSTQNPVVTLHGLGATYYEDINFLGDWLKTQGFCVYRLTYGAYPGFPVLGGLDHINASAAEIAQFISQVHTQTGRGKVDVVGHSEGAFQALYVPKFTGVAPLIDKIVALAPPTHGTDFAHLITLAETLGSAVIGTVREVLNTVGCHACDDLTDGGGWAIQHLNDGTPIVQPGNTVTILTSRTDELVTPPTTSFVDEVGVTNRYVQDICPLDPVGHIGEAYDLNVWNLIRNALDGTPERAFVCVLGSPGK